MRKIFDPIGAILGKLVISSIRGSSRGRMRKQRQAIVAIGLLFGLYLLLHLLYPAPDRPKPRIYVAANFYNCEPVLGNFGRILLDFIKYLGPANVFVSIYENGSQDRTKEYLHALDTRLGLLNVSRHIETNPTEKSFARRIVYLAKLRNVVMDPLIQQYEKGIMYDKVIFFNDIVFTEGDLMELLYTRNLDYHAVCALDYYYQFYDFFATRDQNGHPLGSGYFPYFEDPESQNLLWNNLPIPVYSCWNGLIIMDAAPFYMGLQFHALQPNASYIPGEASECCLIHSDMRDLGFEKIYINPNVKVAYHWRHYYLQKYLLTLVEPFLYLFNHPKSASFQTRIEYERGRKVNSTGFVRTKGEAVCFQ